MYCLEPIWADEMFNMCLKGGPGVSVVQRIPKIQLWPGAVLLVGGLSDLCPQTEHLRDTSPGWGSPEELSRLHVILASHPIIIAADKFQGLIISQALC